MSVDVALIVVGASILAFGLPSNIIKRLWLSVPLLALLVGVLLGPEVLAVVEPDRLDGEHKVLEELARVALATPTTTSTPTTTNATTTDDTPPDAAPPTSSTVPERWSPDEPHPSAQLGVCSATIAPTCQDSILAGPATIHRPGRSRSFSSCCSMEAWRDPTRLAYSMTEANGSIAGARSPFTNF